MTTSVSANPTNKMSSHNSTFDTDLESSQHVGNNNASGEEIVEKIDGNGSAASAADAPNVKQDFPDLAPSRSMEFPDGIRCHH